MKNFDLKSIILGLVISAIGFSAVFMFNKDVNYNSDKKHFETTAMAEDKKIKQTRNNSNERNETVLRNTKVYFNGNEIEIKKPLAIIKNNNNEELYIPADEILEYMNFGVKYNRNENILYLTMGDSGNYDLDTNEDMSSSDIDEKAANIIQKTGNWGYVEKYIPHMSEKGIKKIVDIYNSKHMDVSEHKKYEDYINK